jgi:hypothetical protein
MNGAELEGIFGDVSNALKAENKYCRTYALRQRNRVFTESVGFGEVFSQKPGFWAHASRTIIASVLFRIDKQHLICYN